MQKSDERSIDVADHPYFSSRFLNAIWQHFSTHPNRPALINAKHPADRLTFGELYLYGHSIAAFLHSRSFGHGDVACLALPNCWQYMTVFVGAIIRGGAISGASPIFTDRELQQQFIDSKCKVVFCSAQNIQRVLDAARGSPTISTIVVVHEYHRSSEPMVCPPGVVSFSEVIRTEPRLQDAQLEFTRNPPEKELLLLPYSSGTTGSPKGVMISHRNFNAMITYLNRHFELDIVPVLNDPKFVFTREHHLSILPFYHCYGIGMASFFLLQGSTNVVLDSFDSDVFCQTIEQFKIRILIVVPPILIFLAKNLKVSEYNLTSVSVVMSGAAPAGRELCEELRRRHSNIRYIGQGYGMTELTMASHLPVFDKNRYESAGKLITGLEMKIVDLTTGNELGPERSGEVCVRGPTVMMGYLGRPEATAEMIDHEGWLHTGDIGYADSDGNLYIVDRLKELIKVNGLQVAPTELEDLLFSHSEIEDCAVIGVPDPKAGELPKAFVVKTKGSELDEQQVQEFIKERVVRYKQLGGGVEFVDAIPKSAAGKILRRVLRDWHSTGRTGTQSDNLAKI